MKTNKKNNKNNKKAAAARRAEYEKMRVDHEATLWAKAEGRYYNPTPNGW